MKNALRLLRNDLRLLLRGRGVLVLLIGYPLVVAALVTVALQGGERRPSIAFVNNDTSNRTVRVGDERLGVEDYARRLEREVDVVRLDDQAAADALESGRVSAVVSIPAGFIADLQSGLASPKLGLRVSTRSPIEAQSISRRLEAAVSRLNRELADTYVRQTLDLVNVIIEGGDISIFARQGNVLGLDRSETLVRDLQRQLVTDGQGASATRLDPLLNFIVQARLNLGLASGAAGAISRPIQLEIPDPPDGREPLSGYGFAGALLVSLALVGALLGAAAISSEREEHTLSRLRRGLVRDGFLVGEKVCFGALVCVAIGAVVLVVVAMSTAVAVGRWGLWAAALVAAGLAFAAFGVLVGASARETRGALLATLMLALPLVFLGVFTQSDVAQAIGQVAPFGPAFRQFQTLLVEPEVAAGGFWGRILQLAALATVFATAAALVLRRRSDT